MPDKLLSRERYGEVFWRAHHEAWRHSELNQREYCDAQGLSFGSVWQLASEVQIRTSSAVNAARSRPRRSPTGCGAVVDDHAARAAGEDRSEDRPPWPVDHFPNARSHGAATAISENPGGDR